MRPLAEISLTWTCPLEGPCVPWEELDEVEAEDELDVLVVLCADMEVDPLGVWRFLVAERDDIGLGGFGGFGAVEAGIIEVVAAIATRFGGGGCCILNTGACRERLVVGWAVAGARVGVSGAGLG